MHKSKSPDRILSSSLYPAHRPFGSPNSQSQQNYSRFPSYNSSLLSRPNHNTDSPSSRPPTCRASLLQWGSPSLPNFSPIQRLMVHLLFSDPLISCSNPSSHSPNTIPTASFHPPAHHQAIQCPLHCAINHLTTKSSHTHIVPNAKLHFHFQFQVEITSAAPSLKQPTMPSSSTLLTIPATLPKPRTQLLLPIPACSFVSLTISPLHSPLSPSPL